MPARGAWGGSRWGTPRLSSVPGPGPGPPVLHPGLSLSLARDVLPPLLWWGPPSMGTVWEGVS